MLDNNFNPTIDDPEENQDDYDDTELRLEIRQKIEQDGIKDLIF